MFYASHLSGRQKNQINVDVQEAEFQSYKSVRGDALYALLDHRQTEAELLDARSEADCQNYGLVYPYTFEHGLPGGHMLAFKSYFNTKKTCNKIDVCLLRETKGSQNVYL